MDDKIMSGKTEQDEYAPDKAWNKIHELAGLKGPPNNREERRRVEKVLRMLKKRGLTVS